MADDTHHYVTPRLDSLKEYTSLMSLMVRCFAQQSQEPRGGVRYFATTGSRQSALALRGSASLRTSG
jgi:hypothetical protein